jgi:hypothetical protein
MIAIGNTQRRDYAITAALHRGYTPPAMTGIATVLVGLVPTYATIGIWGAVLFQLLCAEPVRDADWKKQRALPRARHYFAVNISPKWLKQQQENSEGALFTEANPAILRVGQSARGTRLR